MLRDVILEGMNACVCVCVCIHRLVMHADLAMRMQGLGPSACISRKKSST